MTDKERIREEIERLHEEYRGKKGDADVRRALRTVLFFIDSMQEEPKSTWSEEDEKMYRGVKAVCDVWSTATSFYPKENEDVERLKNWLKSLKDRVQHQANWKPAEDQIKALKWVLQNIPYNIHKQNISDMLEQLKKL